MTREVTSVRIHLRHLAMAKPRAICHDGAKRWWKRHDLDWSDFVLNGIAGQVLLDTGCGLAKRVVVAAETEATSGR